MPIKGGKIIGLAMDENGKFTREVPATHPDAGKWMETKNYKMLSKEDALKEYAKIYGTTENQSPVAPGSPVKPPRSTSTIGLGRRKSRRGKKSRRVTRRR